MKNIKIYVAMHKPYPTAVGNIYVPLQVGAARKGEGFCAVKDNTGDNISAKNETFCELTGMYWMYRNSDADVLGLVHYRRYFAGKPVGKDKWKRILDRPRLLALLEKTEVILPQKRHYYLETNYSQYAHAHYEKDLVTTREALSELAPAYVAAFDAVMARRSGHRFNMFIMRRARFDDYCAWLFPVLFELEKRIDLADYDGYNRRVFGFLGERLLDVYLLAQAISYVELPVVNLEPINWLKKGSAFVLRKFKSSENGGKRRI